MIEYINYEKIVEGTSKKTWSIEESNERKFRADPTDGLRLMKKFRRYL